jgi:hypothetical protein
VIRRIQHDQKTPFCKFFLKFCLIVVFFAINWNASPVRGQQASSVSAGPDRAVKASSENAGSPKKNAPASVINQGYGNRLPLPPPPRIPPVVRSRQLVDQKTVPAQAVSTSSPALPDGRAPGMILSPEDLVVPVTPPPAPSMPLSGNYDPGATAVPLYPPAFVPDETTYDSLGTRLLKAYFGKKELEEEEEADHREGVLVPFNSPPFPFAEHIGPVIGYKDTTLWPLMEAAYKGPYADFWKKSRIKVYGWVDPSVTFGTSKQSNIPLSYAIVPNSLQLSQAIVIFERVTDSLQKDHTDWGFKFTNLYGIDYRYTTAKGYFSDQLLKHNHLYGWDPLQMYVDYYIPWIREGMIVRAGRYISPIDIEAQLSPENYLYTHSLMYTYDPYTFTGVQTITKLNKNFTIIIGAQAGSDMAPWTTSSQPNGEFLLKWVSNSGNDALFGGVDSVGRGYFQNGHDDIQIASLVWTHKFNDKFHTLTEAYYDWERDAYTGGSFVDGPPHPYFPFTGPGTYLPGLSDAFGCVNYTAYQVSDKSYVVWRNDVLNDPRGWRTGFAGTFAESTIGWIYHITPWATSRPEIRFDYSTGQKAYDNGTKRDMFTFNWDIILRF